MNKVEKQKGWLMGLGLGLIVLSIILLAVGIGLICGGVRGIAETGGAGEVTKLVFGIIMCVLFAPSIVLGIYFLWIGGYLSATKGSIKEGNIAKEGGTINMVKCDKCGTEIKIGETVCSECGKPVAKTEKIDSKAEIK